MKPKYYSCLFLSLFACDQENIQNTNRKDNLLDGPASTELINNFCEGVKDINDKNDPSACVELTTKLVGEYANSFCSLERCKGIFKQLCKQGPTYSSQIVYDVLYALVKNKWLDADGVRTIIQGIKEENLTVFSLLNNYVEKKFKTCNQGTDDDAARIIAESFGFIFNKTIFIPGINTFTSTPIPPSENAITVDDLTDIWQCVNFIKNNVFDQNSLKKLIALASSGDFNEAIKAIAGAGIFFQDSGNNMMKEFNGKNINLNNEGLQALANCIQSSREIATTAKLKLLIPSLKNCTDLAPILKRCTNGVKVDGKFLSQLAQTCPQNYHDLIESIPKERFNTADDKKAGYLQFLETYHNVNKEGLSPLFSKLPNYFPEDDFITLLDNIDLDSATSLKPLIESLQGATFNLECLKKLATTYKDNSDTFNKVLSKINQYNFDQDNNGDEVIQAFDGKNIQLYNENLKKILFMIYIGNKISDWQKAIDFCCENIKNLNDENIQSVVKQIKSNLKFDLNTLTYLWGKGEGKFNQILPCIPKHKLKKDNHGDNVIDEIIKNTIKLNKNTLPKVLSMIDDKKKITTTKNKDVFQICCENEFNAEDIKNILEKCKDNFKFALDCLDLYETVGKKRFNNVLAAIPDDRFDKNNTGNDVVKKIQTKAIALEEGNLSKVLLLCKDGDKITDVNSLYFVFCRSCNDAEGVKVLITFVEDNSLHGNGVISKINTTDAKTTDAQKAFVEKFYSKIKNSTINIFNKNIAEKFVWFAYLWYKQDSNLTDLKNKMKNDVDKALLNNALKKDTLKDFGGKEITNEDFEAFQNKLSDVLELNK